MRYVPLTQGRCAEICRTAARGLVHPAARFRAFLPDYWCRRPPAPPLPFRRRFLQLAIALLPVYFAADRS